MKAITSKDFLLLVGSKPPAILDRPSFLEAAQERRDCHSYRFGDVLVRRDRNIAVFAAPAELKARMNGQDWSGAVWVTDIWRKGRIRRSWKLAQRIISRPDERPELPKAIKSLQLWK